MKQLIRRLSRVADSSQYCLLRSTDSSAAGSSSARTRRSESFRVLKLRRRKSSPETGVPEGHVPVYVGEEMERFVVSAELLNHPVFVELLNKSAQEYGYEQRGVLRIPCHVVVFERVLEALRLGRAAPSSDITDLLGSTSSSSSSLADDRHFIYAN
ncbi:auxin-responsive protein SAUR71-like [Argentina anserina]|uniref:auxin-responsive protein SAUR71-like n=1 Tax=Argentina anserina TaxID=57926 RepID=UPI00217665FE|nr:auxin-responsive protein SAUR71-like [Potentilla anserina]